MTFIELFLLKRFDLRSDIISNLHITVGTSTLSMNNSFRNSFAGEVGKLVKKVEILGENGATGTSCHGVLVVVDGST